MKTKRLHLIILLITCSAFTMGCALLDLLTPPQPPAPTETVTVPPEEPTATDEPTPTLTPTETPPNHGQIVYAYGGNIWRYQIDSSELTQLTFDGVADSYDGGYRQPLLSADGRFVSYIKNDQSYVHLLADNTVTSLPIQIFQWSRTRPAAFYAAMGGMVCPDVEDLEEQEEINFDLLRYDADDLTAPVLIANVGGGLKFPQAISEDEQYASILHCACYSECGSYVIRHLPSGTNMTPPPDVYAGEVDFSPDGSRLVTSQMQIYGYAQSPLYLANSDFSGAVPIYDTANVAAVNPLWSPDGTQIAFTAYDIAAEFELIDRRVLLTNLDGSVLQEIAVGGAEIADWSPDGSQILFRRGDRDTNTVYLYDLQSNTTTELPFTASSQIDWGVLP